MTIELHYNLLCPHARTALIAVKHLGIDAKLVEIDFQKGETRTPEYLKMNPTHTVPTFVDNGFVVFESRAVVMYLASKYGANTGLYPSDLQARANVDKITFFDSTGYFPAVRTAFAPLFQKQKEPTQEALDDLTDKITILETLLGKQKFFTGNNVTVADIFVGVSVPYLKLFLPKYYSDKLKQWYQRVVEVIPVLGELNEQAEKETLEKFKQMQLSRE